MPFDSSQAVTYDDLPVRSHKFTEEGPRLWRDWMIFGEHPDGTVDVADGVGDVVTRIPRDKAESLVMQRVHFLKWATKLLVEPPKPLPILPPQASHIPDPAPVPEEGESMERTLARRILELKAGDLFICRDGNGDWLQCKAVGTYEGGAEVVVERPAIVRSNGKYRVATDGTMKTKTNIGRGNRRHQRDLIFLVKLPASMRPGLPAFAWAQQQMMTELYGG